MRMKREESADRRLAWSLATIAGAVNAAGFYVAGHYTSHMTGTVSLLADALALGDVGEALVAIAVIAAFVGGAAVSTLLINRAERRLPGGAYAFSLLAEAALLFLGGLIEALAPDALRAPLLILGLSFTMGLQNAIVTRVSNARIRTTHVTGMVTDIGIELGQLLDRRLSPRDDGVAEADRRKLALHIPTVGGFLLGGIAGVIGYRIVGSLLLPLAGCLLIAIAVPAIARRTMASRQSQPLA
ncbi:MAG TPA: YoaK family protein [Aliidongia sp.]|nr:YoaK family protein [Aliidongia sp.]